MPKNTPRTIIEEDIPDSRVSLRIDVPANRPREEVEIDDDPEAEKDPDGYGFGV